MSRSLGLDVATCPGCKGRLRFVATIYNPASARRILRHLGLPAEPVRLQPARAPPDPDDFAVIDSSA